MCVLMQAHEEALEDVRRETAFEIQRHICVLILLYIALYICPNTAVCVSSYYGIRVLVLHQHSGTIGGTLS